MDDPGAEWTEPMMGDLKVKVSRTRRESRPTLLLLEHPSGKVTLDLDQEARWLRDRIDDALALHREHN